MLRRKEHPFLTPRTAWVEGVLPVPLIRMIVWPGWRTVNVGWTRYKETQWLITSKPKGCPGIIVAMQIARRTEESFLMTMTSMASASLRTAVACHFLMDIHWLSFICLHIMETLCFPVSPCHVVFLFHILCVLITVGIWKAHPCLLSYVSERAPKTFFPHLRSACVMTICPTWPGITLGFHRITWRWLPLPQLC